MKYPRRVPNRTWELAGPTRLSLPLRLQPDLDQAADGVRAGRQVGLLSAPFLNRTEQWLMPANADERSSACSTGPTERQFLANSNV